MTCTHCNKPEPDCDCETMAGIYEAARMAKPMLTPEQDAYLRYGKGDRVAIPAITALVREKMRVRPDHPPHKDTDSTLYCMPAATFTLLDDLDADIADWLSDEIVEVFNQRLGSLPFDPDGDIEVLRDPFSSKPYVLFYCTCKMRRPAPAELAGDEMHVLLKNGLYYRPESMGYTGRLEDAGRFEKQFALDVAKLAPAITALPVSTAPRHAPKCDPNVIALDLKADADKALEAERAARVAAEAENARLAETVERETGMIGACCSMFERAIKEGDPQAELLFRVQEIREASDRARAALTQPPSPTGETK